MTSEPSACRKESVARSTVLHTDFHGTSQPSATCSASSVFNTISRASPEFIRSAPFLAGAYPALILGNGFFCPAALVVTFLLILIFKRMSCLLMASFLFSSLLRAYTFLFLYSYSNEATGGKVKPMQSIHY